MGPQHRDGGAHKTPLPTFLPNHTFHILPHFRPHSLSTPNFSSPLACLSGLCSRFLLNVSVKGQHNYSRRNVSVLVQKMKLIHAHTLTHLHYNPCVCTVLSPLFGLALFSNRRGLHSHTPVCADPIYKQCVPKTVW